ncbi:MAG: efflux transporter periplasmic adaptor subunit [Steroidobacteraceae bacterium]|jgi:HlyD family secretion protein|nr:efflux transporter periplasmic adaptor subunit [Steroidobacteraceae bacterium]
MALAMAVVLAAALAIFGQSRRALRVPVDAVSVAKVERSVFRDIIPLRGKVVALETVYLDAVEGGRIEQVFVQPGDAVELGQPIVRLSNTALELEVLDRQARLIESVTQLQTYQTQLEQNRLDNQKALEQIDYNILRLQRTVSRQRELADQGLIARDVSDAASDELAYQTTLRPLQAKGNRDQEQLRQRQDPQIRAQIDKLQKDMEVTARKLDSLVVRAPIDGRMTAIDLKVGQNFTQGQRLGEVTKDGGYKVVAPVDEYYLDRVKEEQQAAVRIGGTSILLLVRRVHPQVASGVFDVEFEFATGPPPSVRPGQAVLGTLALGADSEAVVLATGPFLATSGGSWAFVVDEDGRSAERRAIKIGRRSAEQLEIADGLVPGDAVLISDYSNYERIERITLIR